MKWSLSLLVLLVVNPNSYFSSCQSVRGVFFFHSSLSFILQNVGVIFNHNITPSSSLNTHWFLFVQTVSIPLFLAVLFRSNSLLPSLVHFSVQTSTLVLIRSSIDILSYYCSLHVYVPILFRYS